MPSVLEKLQKIIQLEREQGCENRAVMGGLDRFLTFWEQEAVKESSEGGDLELIGMVVEKLKDYGAKDHSTRLSNVEEVLQALGQEQGATASKAASRREEAEPGKREAQSRKGGASPRDAVVSLDSEVSVLKGVSTAYSRKLERLGVRTVADLLFLVPRRYDDFSALKTISRLVYG